MSDRATRPAGAMLVHPAVLFALAVLVLNDHVFKSSFPGFVTGKLSDFAGMLLFPLVVQGAFELAFARARRRSASHRATNVVLVTATLLTMAAFAAAELSGPGETAYRVGLGMLQWPFRALGAVVAGGALPPIRPVSASADATDLLALPMGLVALALGLRRDHRRALVGATACLTLTLVSWPTPCVAAPDAANPVPYAKRSDRNHDGFYIDAELGGGAFFMSSSASVTNGFRQHLSSSASGAALPSFSLGVGGVLPRTSVAVGARLTRAEVSEPAIETLDQRFSIQDFRLELLDVSLFGRYYVDPHGGFHLGGSLGVLDLGAATSQELFAESNIEGGRDQVGVSLGVEAGQSFWLRPEISAGAVFRFSVARLSGTNGGTTVVSPTLAASLIWN